MSETFRLAPGESLSPEDLKRIAAAARSCKIVVFPTDTVYGIGSTGLIKAAVRRIYQIKARPSLKPLPILVHSARDARRWAQWTDAAEHLSAKFWPGGLTLALKPTEEGRILTFAEYATVALRVPSHPLALSLLEASGVPWATTSANISGSPPIDDGAEAARCFGASADFIIDAGKVAGTESTLVDASRLPVRILRQGIIPASAIMEAVGQAVP